MPNFNLYICMINIDLPSEDTMCTTWLAQSVVVEMIYQVLGR